MDKGFIRAGLAAATVLTAIFLGAPQSGAVVYCKYVGVPKGCVVKPGVVLAPAPVVRSTTVVVTPAVKNPVNLGGPVNRRGVR